MAIVPSLAMVSAQPRVGANEVCMLTVRNTGGSDVTISTISTYFRPAAASGYCGQVQFPPGSTLVVPSAGSLSLPFSLSFTAPPMQGMGRATCAGRVEVCATVFHGTNEAAEASPIVVVPAAALELGQNQNPTQPGWLDFSQSENSYLILF